MSAGLDEAAYADVWSLSDDDLADALVRCEQLAARQAALSLRLIREADARDLGRRQGASSTTAWLKDRLRLRPGEAKARVDLAHRLEGGGHRSMPATATALAAGAVSAEHARVIAKTMVALPGGLSSERERVAETELVGWAHTYDPATVAILGRHLVHALDTDTLQEREDRAHRDRDMRFVDYGDGMQRFGGGGDTEAIALLRTALDPLAAPCPAADGTPDPRTAGQRMFDALIELARRACQHGDLPAGHGVRPHLAVIVSLDTLQRSATEAGVFGRAGGAGPSCVWTPTAPGGAGLGRTDLRRNSAPDRLRRRHHPDHHRPGRRPSRRRPRTPHRHRRAMGRPGRAGPRLRLPRLHPSARVVPRPSPHSLGRRRRYRPGQPRPTLRAPSPGHPPQRLGNNHGRRPTTGIHPTTLDRPRPNTPPKHQTQIRTRRSRNRVSPHR
ncbi:MAG TPA: DUF222 domain-containing protein [Jiangellaceae bacterium]|nr:DUF222 domain-containing protein [Jiangellaceae bacterium]